MDGDDNQQAKTAMQQRLASLDLKEI